MINPQFIVLLIFDSISKYLNDLFEAPEARETNKKLYYFRVTQFYSRNNNNEKRFNCFHVLTCDYR